MKRKEMFKKWCKKQALSIYYLAIGSGICFILWLFTSFTIAVLG